MFAQAVPSFIVLLHFFSLASSVLVSFVLSSAPLICLLLIEHTELVPFSLFSLQNRIIQYSLINWCFLLFSQPNRIIDSITDSSAAAAASDASALAKGSDVRMQTATQTHTRTCSVHAAYVWCSLTFVCFQAVLALMLSCPSRLCWELQMVEI